MKKYFIIILWYLALVFNISCSTRNDSVSVEQKIIEDIFPEIFEYTFEDYRKRPVPPPPPANNSKEELDKMHRAFDKAKEDHKIFLDTTKFAPLYIIIEDSVRSYSKDYLSRIAKNNDLKFIDTTLHKKPFKLDLSKINLGKNYIVKYKSDFSNTLDELKMQDWKRYSKEEKHLWQYSGMLTLSRIYFNKEQNYGFLNVGFNCGKLCGCGYRIFIKKEHDKWVIDKIDDLGCA